jgi:GH15 family glucan-1,4-alpha-glucosidase
LIIQALTNLGYRAEAKAHFNWIKEIVERDGAERLQPYYTLDGGRNLLERETPCFKEYSPNRQFQLDIYGHVLLTISEYYKIFGELPQGLWPKLVEIADYVCQAWRRPDFGPSGDVSRPEHFVVSKLFCWAALDQACWLARSLQQSPSSRWLSEKAILHRTICEQGFDPIKNSFLRSFGDHEMDSSVLWIPLLNFLPFDDLRVQGTIDCARSELSQGVLLRRSKAQLVDPSGERSMPLDLWSSFLFIPCLALLGRVDEASDRLAELCTYTNSLGLFGDQIDLSQDKIPRSFPSSSAHFSLINAALYLGSARGRLKPLTPLVGMQENLLPKIA